MINTAYCSFKNRINSKYQLFCQNTISYKIWLTDKPIVLKEWLWGNKSVFPKAFLLHSSDETGWWVMPLPVVTSDPTVEAVGVLRWGAAPHAARPPTLSNLCIFAVALVVCVEPLSQCTLGVGLMTSQEQNRLSVKRPYSCQSLRKPFLCAYMNEPVALQRGRAIT